MDPGKKNHHPSHHSFTIIFAVITGALVAVVVVFVVVAFVVVTIAVVTGISIFTIVSIHFIKTNFEWVSFMRTRYLLFYRHVSINTFSAEVRRKIQAASDKWNLKLSAKEVEEYGGNYTFLDMFILFKILHMNGVT